MARASNGRRPRKASAVRDEEINSSDRGIVDSFDVRLELTDQLQWLIGLDVEWSDQRKRARAPRIALLMIDADAAERLARMLNAAAAQLHRSTPIP